MGDSIGSDSSCGAACNDDVPDCERPPTIEVSSGESLSVEGSGGDKISVVCLPEEQKEARKKNAKEKKKLKKLDEKRRKKDAQANKEARPEVSGSVAVKDDKAKAEVSCYVAGGRYPAPKITDGPSVSSAPAAGGVGKNTERNRKHKLRNKNKERKRQEEEARRKEEAAQELAHRRKMFASVDRVDIKEENVREDSEEWRKMLASLDRLDRKGENAREEAAQELEWQRMLASLDRLDIEAYRSIRNMKSKKASPAKLDIVSNQGEATLTIESLELDPKQTVLDDEKEVPKQNFAADSMQFYVNMWNRMTEASAKGKEEKTKCSDDDHALKLQEFLTKYKRKEGEKEFYPAQVLTLKQIGSYDLIIEFDHLLSDVRYKNLVIRIGRGASNDWLNGAVERFFMANGMANEKFGTLVKKVSLTFNGKKSFENLADFMGRKPLWKTTINGEVPLTRHGRTSTRLLIWHLLDNHIEKKSFSGRFAQGDILLSDDFCWIYGDLLENQGDPSYAADFSRIWEVMSPHYKILDAENKASYPLKFEALESSLKLTGIGEGKAQIEAVQNFLRYHSSLASPEANRTFTVELCRSVKYFGHQNKPFLQSIPHYTAWQNWRAEKSATVVDWRRDIANMSLVLDGVMNYNPGNAKTTHGSMQATFGSSKQATFGGSKPVQQNRYGDTVWDLSNLRRCVIDHGHEHTGGLFVIENSNSIELHASRHLPDLLPYLLYNMLNDVELSGKDSKYASLWIIYKALYDKGQD